MMLMINHQRDRLQEAPDDVAAHKLTSFPVLRIAHRRALCAPRPQ